MAVAYGTRINDDTNFITTIDLDEKTCETTGYIDGEAVDFSGGGSSDFSTAEVTVINNCAEGISIAAPVPSSTPMDVLLPTTHVAANSSSTITVVLYKGAALCVLIGETEFVTDVSCTGDIEFIQGSGLLITGNGTITIS